MECPLEESFSTGLEQAFVFDRSHSFPFAGGEDYGKRILDCWSYHSLYTTPLHYWLVEMGRISPRMMRWVKQVDSMTG